MCNHTLNLYFIILIVYFLLTFIDTQILYINFFSEILTLQEEESTKLPKGMKATETPKKRLQHTKRNLFSSKNDSSKKGFVSFFFSTYNYFILLITTKQREGGGGEDCSNYN